MVAAGIIFASCNKVEPIPAALQVEPFDFQTTTGQGSASENIRLAWLFVDDQALGVYELPTDIQVLNSGNSDITLYPGIEENGSSITPEIYPFYKPHITTADLTEGESFLINPTTEYVDNVEFAFLSGFEGGNLFGDDIDGNPQTAMRLTGDTVFEGSYSGYIQLTDGNKLIEVASTQKFDDLPRDLTPIFIELDYKNDVNFEVGIVALENGTQLKVPKVTLRPQGEWNKVYISIDEELAVYPAADKFQLYFRCLLPDNVAEGNIYLDNIKLVHYK